MICRHGRLEIDLKLFVNIRIYTILSHALAFCCCHLTVSLHFNSAVQNGLLGQAHLYSVVAG